MHSWISSWFMRPVVRHLASIVVAVILAAAVTYLLNKIGI